MKSTLCASDDLVVEIRGITALFAQALNLENKSYTGVGYAPQPQNKLGEALVMVGNVFIGEYLRLEINAYPELQHEVRECRQAVPALEQITELSQVLHQLGYRSVEILGHSSHGALGVVFQEGCVFEARCSSVGTNEAPSASVQHVVFHDYTWDVE